MARVDLFGLGVVSRSPYVSAKYLQNMYAETRPQGENSSLVAYQRPGFNLRVDQGATPWRGGLEVGDYAYAVHRGTLYQIDNANVATARGVLATTSGRVSMADNGVQVMITDGTSGYIYNTQTLAFAQITAIGFPANPITCTFLGGRFIANFAGSGRFYWSALYDGLTWDALSFANAEASPDNIVAVWTSNGQLVLFGVNTTEFWGLSGTADSPFSSLQGTATEWGLAATWSIAKYDNTMACLMKNRTGQVMVASLNGYQPKKISTPDIDYILSTYANVADASFWSAMQGGHQLLFCNFPTAGKTWMQDALTGFWQPQKSYGLSRFRIEFAFSYFTNIVGADYDLGRLYTITAAALTDNGDSIEREIVGETLIGEDGSFIDVECLRIGVETGVGLTSGQGENPQISLSVSRDHGKTWGAEMWRDLGKIGEYKTYVEWRRLGGSSRQFTPKIRITDPVPLVLTYGCINPPA